MRPDLARRMVSRDVATDLELSAVILQGELLAKQGEAHAQTGEREQMRERLRSFARRLEDAESLSDASIRGAVREVRRELAALGAASTAGEVDVQRGREVSSVEPAGHAAAADTSLASERVTGGTRACGLVRNAKTE